MLIQDLMSADGWEWPRFANQSHSAMASDKTCRIETSGEHRCKSSRFDRREERVIQRMDPRQLVTPARLDLISKIAYAKECLSGMPTRETTGRYRQFVRALSNGVREGEGDQITHRANPAAAFASLIRNISEHGFDCQAPILLGEDGSIVDGAHRLAVMIALQKDIPAAMVAGSGKAYDCSWFLRQGLSDIVVESSLLGMAAYLSGACIFILWPSMSHAQKKEAIRILESRARRIIYMREEFVRLPAVHALAAFAYAKEDWVGSMSTRFDGAMAKAKQVLGNNQSKLTAIMVDISGPDALIAKTLMRSTMGLGYAGVHCTDSHEEALLLAHVLFNPRARRRLGLGRRYRLPRVLGGFLWPRLPFMPASGLQQASRSGPSSRTVK